MGLVYDGWITSFRKSQHVGPIPSEHYYDVFHGAVEVALSRDGMKVAVAEHGTVLLGFAAGIPPDGVAYVFLKPHYRRMGLCRALLAYLGIDTRQRLRCAYWTKDWKACVRGAGWRAEYAPEIVRYPHRKEQEIGT
jgi:hypothetical protein